MDLWVVAGDSWGQHIGLARCGLGKTMSLEETRCRGRFGEEAGGAGSSSTAACIVHACDIFVYVSYIYSRTIIRGVLVKGTDRVLCDPHEQNLKLGIQK